MAAMHAHARVLYVLYMWRSEKQHARQLPIT